MWIITGANGSIGNNLVSFFLSNKERILAITSTPAQLYKYLDSNNTNYNDDSLNIFQDDYKKNLYNEELNLILEKNKIKGLIISSGQYFNGSFLSTKYESYIDNYRSNFESCVRYISQLTPYLSRNSNIVVVNSIASKIPQKTEGPYAISKKSISVFIDSIADELKEKQIYITDLVSGGVKSSITKNRSNYDKLIDPEELASQIYEITRRKKTLTIRRIELTRSK